jgi:phage protein D
MSNGRKTIKQKPKTGFERAALALTLGLSDEATNNLTTMVKDVASEYGYNDSVMIRRLNSRLRQAARTKAGREWAQEVLTRLEGATA